MKYLVAILRVLSAYTGLLICGSVCSILYLVSFGHLRRFNNEYIAPVICKIILFCLGLKININLQHKYDEPGIYFFNHNSYLDLFAIPCLALKNTRLITSTRTKSNIPLLLCNIGFGSLFLPFKDQPEKRVDGFKYIEKKMTNENFSVICSPEGVHTFKNKIGKFNKGVFHMATVTKRPIYPLFIDIPERSNPLESYFYKSGQFSVTSHPKIDTTSWTIEDLEKNLESVRNLYISLNHENENA